MTGAEREIRRRIEREGAIPFAEFMELALYHPDGYYAARRGIGASGDYYTSPIVHPAFGALISVQLRVMWETLGRPSRFHVVEAGAGDGTLARDILSFAGEWSEEFAGALSYVAVDRAPSSADGERDGVRWIRDGGLPLSGIVGCVLSNELLDAFPVHRFAIEDGELRELYVTLDEDGRLGERLGAPSTPAIGERLSRLGRQLPDGFRGEVNLGIEGWTRASSSALERGYVLTIDYGAEADALYSDARSGGTFQTHYRHVGGSSPYQRIGRQDMTAHVDFSALPDAGRDIGLRPVFLTTQGEFLRSLGLDGMMSSMGDSGLDARELAANLRAMSELAKPDGLGGFRVLVQEKRSGISRSSELLPDGALLGGLPLPLMRGDNLFSDPPDAGAGMSFETESLWPSDDRL